MLLSKYIEYSSQNAEISEKILKSSYNIKKYIFPSGKVINCQGYEPFGLEKLFKEEKINENDIITLRTEVPIIWYNDTENKKHRYFVDIYIPSQKKMY